MIELDFLGRSGDGSSIVFSDANGERFSVAITDELRAAVKKQPLLAGGQAQSPSRDLRPRDIQALLREGQTTAEIAQRHGLPLDAITKYEAPVLAEQSWAITQAQQAIIGSDAGAPSLEDLVINRLAARGVDHRALSWAARRTPGEEYWEVSVTFVQNGLEKSATWKLSLNGTRIEAIDEEAKWLTETVSSLNAVPAFFPPVTSTQATVRPIEKDQEEESEDVDESSTSDEITGFEDTTTIAVESLIDRANALRGKRQPLVEEIESDEVAEDNEENSFFSARVIPLEPLRGSSTDNTPGKHQVVQPNALPKDQVRSVHSDASLELKTEVPEVTEPVSGTEKTDTEDTAKKKPKRRSVPSWDEIVFGAKHD